MKILVTGKEGQVARCLADQVADHPQLELVFAARKNTPVFLDLTDEASIRATVQSARPDIIINAAAYTAVDQAEDEPELAMQINGIAPGILAEEAAKLDSSIIQISTDYVFDGELDRPYLPSDPVSPIGVYGKTKLAGEEAVRAATPNHLIVRTAWVYSPYGKNFYKTMLKLAETRDELKVVDDQHGSPTYAADLANVVLHISDRLGRKTFPADGYGTFHCAGAGETTWCGFARTIFELASPRFAKTPVVAAIPTSDYPTPAKRPANSVLDCAELANIHGLRMRPWFEALAELLSQPALTES